MINARLTGSVKVGNKKYSYTITPQDDGSCWFECDGANLAQFYPLGELHILLNDLPDLIIDELEYRKTQNRRIQFRVTLDEQKAIEKKAVKRGFSSTSAYLRNLALAA